MLCSRAQCVVHVVAVLRIVALIIDDIRGLRKTAGMLFTHVSKSNQHCFWSIWWSAGIFLSCCLLMNQLYRNKLISYVKNFNSISCIDGSGSGRLSSWRDNTSQSVRSFVSSEAPRPVIFMEPFKYIFAFKVEFYL